MPQVLLLFLPLLCTPLETMVPASERASVKTSMAKGAVQSGIRKQDI